MALLNFPESAPPPGSTPIRTDEEKAADLEALAAEFRQWPSKMSIYRGVTKSGTTWQVYYRRVYLGDFSSVEEAAVVYDQVLLLHLGR